MSMHRLDVRTVVLPEGDSIATKEGLLNRDDQEVRSHNVRVLGSKVTLQMISVERQLVHSQTS